ncbi:hypothetical protein A2348_05285 [Candidatus Uhrbacteria bacterium RIFOXYB12_FULL_58_10]|uniref:YprB ribonuclease H-like domain-containing protein n=1 Tax=Candidatus Uhrbacteria bacterium RIFOXYB2_FULL_57_15 TaxID=1802422 RepID=A0A1F7W694_9BACT|nr:MAG: hypothetical protein A2348_05285 [Candidatus Uhrbacteria bacterium RIFOXYB12_FULL_58_10]OGL97707.1 MAG: hypothetical protein A2304_00385 [Candidatus Uhrbacteria bacterium RIFOXYB2_FULL_57_15]OGM00038.1 MAG: hypothetical protein A2501_03750 [Candidatus Uhrbacteria bacterium RIFOXYC12_FULL_57_11]
MRQITETTFYQFIKCPNWVYFDAHTIEEKPHDPLLLRLMQDGLMDDVKQRAISDRPDLAEVDAEDPDEAFRQTLAFMREGRETIYRGVLIDKHWVGHPDILARVEGSSRLGSYYYVAADIKRSREVRDEFKFQGCFYAELLSKIQGTKPTQGYVITPDGDALAYLVNEFEAQYKLTLDEIEAIVAGKRPVHFVTSACKQSPWFSECRRESEACNELSVLNRVWNEEVLRLDAAGIRTIDALAARSVHDLLRMCPDINHGRMEMLRDQAIAIRDNHHIVRGPARFPKAAIEVYFDIESDPLRDFDYLFGAMTVKNGKEAYHAFLAKKPEDEGKAWAEFVTFVESHLDAPIYHYGWFEREVVNRFAAKYGCSDIAREAFERNMVDIMEVIRASVIFPLTFYSLKDIAAYVGFSWRSEDASGANSVLWFESWLKKKDKKTLDKILAYNEDDVRATHIVKEWLEKHTV